MEKIKIYKNYSKNTKKYYLSTKVGEDYYYINKAHNEDLYLDMDALNQKELDKTLFKRKEKDSKILIFKDAEKEREFCVSKEELEKRKAQRKTQSVNVIDYINDLVKEIITTNDLLCGNLCSKLFLSGKAEEEDLKPAEDINEDDLPF